MPSAVRATSTVSIVARISQPIASSVIPSVSSMLAGPRRWRRRGCPSPERRTARPQHAKPADRTTQQANTLDQPAAAGADSDRHSLADRSGQSLDDLLMCGCLDVGDGLGVRYGKGDLGELWHRKIGMEGKFDSFEQLFPRVHHPDANAVRPPLPYRGDRCIDCVPRCWG